MNARRMSARLPRTVFAAVALVGAVTLAACGGNGGSVSSEGADRNAKVFARDVSMIIRNDTNRTIDLTVTESASNNEGNQVIGQYARLQVTSGAGYDADYAEAILRLRRNVTVRIENFAVGSPEVTVDGVTSKLAAGSNWVAYDSNPRIFIERKADTEGFVNFEVWVGA